MTLTTPGGNLTSSCRIFMTQWNGTGVISLGFITTVSPTANAYGMNQKGTITGKLNGEMIPATPKGSLIRYSSIPLAISSNCSPFCRIYATPIAVSIFSIALLTSPLASSIVLPWFWTTNLANSSLCLSIASFILNKYCTLVGTGVSLHLSKALAADSIALSTSSIVANGTSAIFLPLAGFITASHSSVSDSTNLPSMYNGSLPYCD